MKKRLEKIVFFGSGPVSEKSLKSLKDTFEIEAVVTKPTTYKSMMGILTDASIYTVNNQSELSDLVIEKRFKSKIGVVVDFGIIITRPTIDYFPKGIINSHFSLLPRWRGADPISFSILSGDRNSGVSLMLIDENLDTGKLIAQENLGLKPNHTTPKLTEDLVALSNKMLANCLPEYIKGNLEPYPQPHPEKATYSRKLRKSDGIIDWHKSSRKIEREVRAFYGWPKSHTKIGGKDVIITKAHTSDGNGKPGSIETSKNNFAIYCGSGKLNIDYLQPSGKKEMTAKAFMAGNKI